MAVSKESAVVAALEYLGVEAVVESGVGFNGVVEEGPVDGLLQVGEIIVAVDDDLITGLESLLEFLSATDPGTEVQITLEDVDTGELRTQSVTLGAHPEGRPGGFIGIMDVTVRAVDADLPFELDIDSGSIGGPSAGLAFTLTIIDLLTEGELTGGGKVAVTGTISAGGSVGDVGGVAQKARAAEDAVPRFSSCPSMPSPRPSRPRSASESKGSPPSTRRSRCLPVLVATSATWRFRSTVSRSTDPLALGDTATLCDALLRSWP
jgi:PDZ domain-containing protein